MGEDARQRLEQLVGEPSYASERGIMITPINYRGRDGKLTSVMVSPVPDVESDDNPPSRTLYFAAESTVANYWEEYENRAGKRYGIGEKAPVDFSESYKIGDIWSGHYASEDWPRMVEFDDARGLIDFLAERLTSPETRISEEDT